MENTIELTKVRARIQELEAEVKQLKELIGEMNDELEWILEDEKKLEAKVASLKKMITEPNPERTASQQTMPQGTDAGLIIKLKHH